MFDLSGFNKISVKLIFKLITLGVSVIIAFVSILILFPFIDTNFFYANRIKSRIDILQKITELDMDKINQDKNLTKEYESIVKEIINKRLSL